MADYIYLLETRLSPAQQSALRTVREIARGEGLTVFLVGGAVRDLTSGSPVRDLDVVVQANALKLNKLIEKAGAVLTGTNEVYRTLHLRFPHNVRVELGSTLSVAFPKPGKPVVTPATILDDLRRRDFTANAMALSLNEGSYGLLMDPLNGVADIENRELRLVSNYGFIEDPVRMIRAARYSARLGWQLETKTQTRYDTGRDEGYIAAMQDASRGYEVEEIVHEEDPLRVLRKLETEGWMAHLAPAWTAAKANVVELDKLRDAQMQLQVQGVSADPSAAMFPLLTAKMTSKDVAALKAMFPRQGFVTEIEGLDAEAKRFAAELSGKQAASASASWKLIAGGKPEAVLWTAYSTKSAALQAKFKSFYTEWPAAKQKIPYVLMQEMRITPEVPRYDELLEGLLFELMDGKLGTVEEMKAYMEPFSPPAPPPPVSLRRPRAPKKEAKTAKNRKKAVVADDDSGDDLDTPSGTAASGEASVPEIAVVPVAPPQAAAGKSAGATRPSAGSETAGAKPAAAGAKAAAAGAKPEAAGAKAAVAPKTVAAPEAAAAGKSGTKAAPSKAPAAGKAVAKKAASSNTPAVNTPAANAPAVNEAAVKVPAVKVPAVKTTAAKTAKSKSAEPAKKIADRKAPAKAASSKASAVPAKKAIAKKAATTVPAKASKSTVGGRAASKGAAQRASTAKPAAKKNPAKKSAAKTVPKKVVAKAAAKKTAVKSIKTVGKAASKGAKGRR